MEIQRLILFFSMSACANVNEAMQKLTGIAQNDSLFNIANGMTAQQVEISRIIGKRILASMIGKTVGEFHFLKAMTLGPRSTVTVMGESVKVDPQLIFQRLVAIGERGEDLPSLFKYKLCSYPFLFWNLFHFLCRQIRRLLLMLYGKL